MSALPPVFDVDPPGFRRGTHPFPGVLPSLAGFWRSTKGAPLGLDVIATEAPHDDGLWWRHVSVARVERVPSWNDVRMVKQAFVGDRYAFMVFPDEAHYVSIHNNCLHLYAVREGADGNMLPDFSQGTGSI